MNYHPIKLKPNGMPDNTLPPCCAVELLKRGSIMINCMVVNAVAMVHDGAARPIALCLEDLHLLNALSNELANMTAKAEAILGADHAAAVDALDRRADASAEAAEISAAALRALGAKPPCADS